MKTTPQTFLKFIAGTAVAAAVLFLIWYFSSIVVYILVSAVLAVMGRPLVNRLAALHVRGWRVPRWLAALVTLVVIWALFALCCSLFVPLVFNKINQFSTVDFASVVNSIGEPIARMQQDLQNLFALSESSFSLSDELVAMFRQVVDMESVNRLFSSVVGVVLSSVIALFSISFITFFFIPELTGFKYRFDTRLMKRMLGYSWPILILGIAGILNQTADKIIFPLVYGDTEAAKSELGIYGACVKIAMIMAMITQAFRYAYEPFVFGKAKDKNSGETYATIMKFFIIFTLLAYLCVIGYMDILKRIIAPDYWPGLRVVPIVMAAEIMMGFTSTFPFGTSSSTRHGLGAWFSAAGCLVLFAVNIIFIPTYSYMACAWGGFAGYATAMLLSYIVGQKKNPVRYPLKSIGIYVLIAGGFYAIMACTPEEWPVWTRLGINTVLILLFVGHILKHDLPVRSLPVIGKYFRKFQK